MITSEILRVWALRLPREVRRRQRKDSTHDEAAGERDSNQTGSLVRLGSVGDGASLTLASWEPMQYKNCILACAYRLRVRPCDIPILGQW